MVPGHWGAAFPVSCWYRSPPKNQAWGVSKIDFVDNGLVSFSNPVRQNLFSFSDAERKVPKALAAAANLKLIHPLAQANGYELTVPMPGHGTSDTCRSDASALDELIRSATAVFLCTDSRESRWLPTVASACHDKLVINAALGFDSFLAMRHGRAAELEQRVSCYFCQDTIAPSDVTALLIFPDPFPPPN